MSEHNRTFTPADLIGDEVTIEVDFGYKGPPPEYVQVLDCSDTTLLDGKGNPLPEGAEPVWLNIDATELALGVSTNSKGETFKPYP